MAVLDIGCSQMQNEIEKKTHNNEGIKQWRADVFDIVFVVGGTKTTTTGGTTTGTIPRPYTKCHHH